MRRGDHDQLRYLLFLFFREVANSDVLLGVFLNFGPLIYLLQCWWLLS